MNFYFFSDTSSQDFERLEHVGVVSGFFLENLIYFVKCKSYDEPPAVMCGTFKICSPKSAAVFHNILVICQI